jgi:hypothetical protein
MDGDIPLQQTARRTASTALDWIEPKSSLGILRQQLQTELSEHKFKPGMHGKAKSRLQAVPSNPE